MPASIDPAPDFLDLAGRVIDKLGLPRPVMQASDGDALDVDLRIDGVQVSLCYEPGINPGHFLVDARIGRIGSRPGAAQRLLVENAALLDHGGLTMGCHPGTDEVSYLALLEIAAAQADGVADCVRVLVRRAHLRGHGTQAMASSTLASEATPRPAVTLSDTDRRAAFDEQIRSLCDYLEVETEEEGQTAAGGRSVMLAVGEEPVLLTHRTPIDAFFVARGAGEVLSVDVEDSIACRLLQSNAEFAHEGTIAFALTPDFRHVVWRVTSALSGARADELVSLIRWASDTAACTDADRPPSLSIVHMLA